MTEEQAAIKARLLRAQGFDAEAAEREGGDWIVSIATMNGGAIASASPAILETLVKLTEQGRLSGPLEPRQERDA